MKLFALSAGLAAVMALCIGLIGDALLRETFRRHAQGDFKREIGSIAQIVAATQWQQPWESDPNWSLLERRLGVDILPLKLRALESKNRNLPPEIIWSQSPSGQNRMTATVVLPAAGEFPGKIDSETETVASAPIQRMRVAQRSQITTRIPTLASLSSREDESQAIVAVQVTREVSSAEFDWIWLAGWTAMSFLGLSIVAIAFSVLQIDRQWQQGLLTPWLTALQSNQPANSSGFLPNIDTESKLAPALGIVTEAINQVVGDLQGENNRSELVLGNLQEGVLAIDDRSHVLLANNALYRLLGLPQESYLDRLLLEIVRVPAVNEVARRVLNRQIPCEELVELTKPQRSLRVLGRPLPLAPQRSGALITIRDETMFRRIESIRRDFVANASHELKTPLAAIRAFAETLQLGALDDRAAAEQFVGNIIEQADRINGLVQGMLQLSRVESGTALKIEYFDARAAAEPCIAAAAAMARTKSVRVESDFPDGALEIFCDRDGFQTIASNLLSNAVRYTPDGGHVWVVLDRIDDFCRLRVSDTGIGIHPDDLGRIFERFYRAEKDRSSDSGGTGLGLSIVKHLAQALNGSVSASSTPGQGSTFEVRLPLSTET